MSEPIHIDIAGSVERLHALNRSESGIGRFSPELRLVFRPAVTKGQPAGKKKKVPNMYQPIQLKTLTPLFIILLGCVWLGLWPKAQAVSPPPDGAYGPPAYGEGNTAEGQDALLELTTGTFNTAVGLTSLQSNTEGSLNTAIGAGTLVLNNADHNTAIGAGALLFNTTGSDNTASGFFALFSNSEGSSNTANGVGALASNTTGSFNTATGDVRVYLPPDANCLP